MRGLPATTPKVLAIRRSDLRSLDSAVQSRVGDGFLAVPLDLVRELNKCNPMEVARLPEHEVRGDCQGLKPTSDYGVPRQALRRRG